MTQALFYSSNAVAMTLAAGIGSGDTSCSLSVATGLPASFPFKLLIGWGTGQQEVVHCTALSGITATISRGQDGTTAQSHSIGASVVHGVSAREFNDLELHVAASSGVHGLAGSVVGTTDAQTLANKTLTAPTLSGAVAGTYAPGTVLAHRQEDVAHYASNVAASGGTATFTTAGPSIGTFQSGYVINTYIVARSTGGDGVGWAWFVTQVFREVGNAQAFTTLASSGGTSGSYTWGVTTNQWRLNATAVAADGSSVTFTATNTAATQMQYRAEHVAMA